MPLCGRVSPIAGNYALVARSVQRPCSTADPLGDVFGVDPELGIPAARVSFGRVRSELGSALRFLCAGDGPLMNVFALQRVDSSASAVGRRPSPWRVLFSCHV